MWTNVQCKAFRVLPKSSFRYLANTYKRIESKKLHSSIGRSVPPYLWAPSASPLPWIKQRCCPSDLEGVGVGIRLSPFPPPRPVRADFATALASGGDAQCGYCNRYGSEAASGALFVNLLRRSDDGLNPGRCAQGASCRQLSGGCCRGGRSS